MLDPSGQKKVAETVSQTNATAIGLGPAVSIVQTQLGLAQSQSALFAGMVSNFQNQNIAANAAMARGVLELYEHNHRDSAQQSQDLLRILNPDVDDDDLAVE